MTMGKTCESSDRRLIRLVFFLRPADKLEEVDEEAVALCRDEAPLLSSDRLTCSSLSCLVVSAPNGNDELG